MPCFQERDYIKPSVNHTMHRIRRDGPLQLMHSLVLTCLGQGHHPLLSCDGERSAILNMAKSKILYQEKVGIYAKYHHPGSDDFLEYNATIQIKDLGKQPIIAKMKFNGLVPFHSFTFDLIK